MTANNTGPGVYYIVPSSAVSLPMSSGVAKESHVAEANMVAPQWYPPHAQTEDTHPNESAAASTIVPPYQAQQVDDTQNMPRLDQAPIESLTLLEPFEQASTHQALDKQNPPGQFAPWESKNSNGVAVGMTAAQATDLTIQEQSPQQVIGVQTQNSQTRSDAVPVPLAPWESTNGMAAGITVPQTTDQTIQVLPVTQERPAQQVIEVQTQQGQAPPGALPVQLAPWESIDSSGMAVGVTSPQVTDQTRQIPPAMQERPPEQVIDVQAQDSQTPRGALPVPLAPWESIDATSMATGITTQQTTDQTIQLVTPPPEQNNHVEPNTIPVVGKLMDALNADDDIQMPLSQQVTTQAQPLQSNSDNRVEAVVRFQQLPPEDPTIVDRVGNHEKYSLLMNVEDDLPFQQGPQIPYFWHIHKSGGSTMKHLLTCLDRIQTRRMTEPTCNDEEPDLKVCPLEWGSVVNADASSPTGIERIIRLNLADRNIDRLVLDTSRVYEALSILKPQHRGRLFVVLRDPVERAISKFYYTKVATWERNYKPAVQNMTMLEYANSTYCYNDWVTRRLVNKMVGHLVPDDLAMAKEILRQKALILFMSNMSDAGERLLTYFGWGATEYQHSCIRKFAVEEPINTNPHPVPSRDSPEWKAIQKRNYYDVKLYEYAQQLYDHQTGLLKQLST